MRKIPTPRRPHDQTQGQRPPMTDHSFGYVLGTRRRAEADVNLADIAELANQITAGRRTEISRLTAAVADHSAPAERRYADYWHLRLLHAEDQTEALYVTQHERNDLVARYASPEATAVPPWLRGNATMWGRPVVVDAERARMAIDRAGPVPPKPGAHGTDR